MKRICLLILALLLLAACGRAEPVPVTAVPTAAEIQTVKIVDWQMEETRTLMEPTGIIVFEKKGAYGNQEIWLRDRTSKEETLLLDMRPDGAVPQFDQEINERYFAFHYGTKGLEIFDIAKLRAIELSGYFTKIGLLADGSIRVYEEPAGPNTPAFRFELSDLEGGSPVIVVEESPELKETQTLMETPDIVVFGKANDWSFRFARKEEIWLRDKTTGEETLLLGVSDYPGIGAVPHFSRQINNRYFVYSYSVPDTCNSEGGFIYDLQKQRAVTIELPWVFVDRVADGKVFWKEVQEGDEPGRTFCVDIADLDSDSPITPKEVH